MRHQRTHGEDIELEDHGCESTNPGGSEGSESSALAKSLRYRFITPSSPCTSYQQPRIAGESNLSIADLAYIELLKHRIKTTFSEEFLARELAPWDTFATMTGLMIDIMSQVSSNLHSGGQANIAMTLEHFSISRAPETRMLT